MENKIDVFSRNKIEVVQKMETINIFIIWYNINDLYYVYIMLA